MTANWTKPDIDNLIIDCKYARAYGFRLTRFYKRSNTLIKAAQILAGSAGFSVIINQNATVAVWTGAIVAILAVIDLLLNPGEKQLICSHASQEWGKLAARSHQMSHDDLLFAVEDMLAKDLPQLDILIYPVYNQVMKQIGRDDLLVKLTIPQRIAEYIL